MAEPLPIDWECVARRSAHPLRIAVLECLARDGGALSLREIAARVAAPLGNVAYHVRQLEAARLIELTRTTPRRGALEHLDQLAARRRPGEDPDPGIAPAARVDA